MMSTPNQTEQGVQKDRTENANRQPGAIEGKSADSGNGTDARQGEQNTERKQSSAGQTRPGSDSGREQVGAPSRSRNEDGDSGSGEREPQRANERDGDRQSNKAAQGGNQQPQDSKQPREGDKLKVDGSSQSREKSSFADAKQPEGSTVLSAPFKSGAPADKADDSDEIPKGASAKYREKYTEVMRDFRAGKLQQVVADRSIALAIASRQAEQFDSTPAQKQASGSDQKQAR
jgi:hypothetical protein